MYLVYTLIPLTILSVFPCTLLKAIYRRYNRVSKGYVSNNLMKLNESEDNTNMLQVGESEEKTSSH